MSLQRLMRRVWRSSPEDWSQRLRRRIGRVESEDTASWVWCLSTGRVGTQTLAALANLSEEVDGQHEPKPHLFGLSKVSYEVGADPAGQKVLAESVRLLRSQRRGRIYIETSPQVTFLAPVLKEVFPGSRFIHVVRHPAAVVRSGMRRNWYNGNRYDDVRIVPQEGRAQESWDGYSILEKNAWLWAETNRWISEFMKTVPAEDALQLRSEELFDGKQAAVDDFFRVLGVSTPRRVEIEQVLGQRLNQQTSGEFPQLGSWSDEELAELQRQTGLMAEALGYPLTNGQ